MTVNISEIDPSRILISIESDVPAVIRAGNAGTVVVVAPDNCEITTWPNQRQSIMFNIQIRSGLRGSKAGSVSAGPGGIAVKGSISGGIRIQGEKVEVGLVIPNVDKAGQAEIVVPAGSQISWRNMAVSHQLENGVQDL